MPIFTGFFASAGGGEEGGLVAGLERREGEVRGSASDDGLDAIAEFRAGKREMQQSTQVRSRYTDV